MFRSFTAERFRGFERLELNDLGRINLFIGANNTGKTAVLEAMFLHLAPTQPQLATAFPHRGQGEEPGQIGRSGLGYESEWRSLFLEREGRLPITLSSVMSDDKGRELFVRLRRSDQFPSLISGWESETEGDDDEVLSTDGQPVELVFEFHDGDGNSWLTAAFVSSRIAGTRRERIRVRKSDRSDSPTMPPGRFISTARPSRTALAEQLSKALDGGMESVLVDTLRLLDPRLRSFVIRVQDSYPAVHVDVGLSRPMPLRMMGEGMARVLEISLAIINVRGILFIDEVENGLHYSVLPDVWRAIGRAAETADVQVMATTHSYECVRAAHLAAADAAVYDLRVHRLERDRDGKVFVTGYDRESLDTSLDLEWEIR